MRLKEAVSTLRLVKTELESSRNSYAELEAKHREVLKKLQVGETKETGAVDKKDDEGGDIHDGEATPSEVCAATLHKELLEAHEAAARWEEERRAMGDEARSMRDELAALKESMANQSQKLKEALDGKEDAIQAAEQARVRAMAAEDMAAKQETRAVTAEEQLEGASNLAEIFRIRLEEMSTEKGSACTLLADVRVGVKEEIGGEGGGEKSKDDEEDAAELERELNLIREALTGQASSTNGSKDEDSLSRGTVKEARQKVERLQAKLDSTTNENSKLRESLENARKESEAARERAAVALEESKALKVVVAAAVAAREQVERIAAEERTKREKKFSSLRESQQTLLAELAKVEAKMREAKKEAAEAVDASSSRIAVLQARVKEAEATRDAALDARNSEGKLDPESLSAGEVELEGDTISVGTWRDAATTGREEKRRVVILQHGACGFDICIRPCECCQLQNTAVETVQDSESQQERDAAMVVNNGDGDDQEEEEILEPSPPPPETRRKGVKNKEEEEVKPSKKRKREDTNRKKTVAKKGKKGDKLKVFVGRLSRQIKDDELREFFKPCGKIKSLELLKKPKGRTTATVRFGTAAAALKAVGMNGRELGGRTLAISMWRAELYTTVYVGNLSWSINEEAIRDTFGKCGEIKNICFAEDQDTGRFLGYCHVEFIDESSVGAALELMGTVVMGRPLCVDFSDVRKGRGKGKDEDMDRRGSETRSPLPKQGIKPFKGTRTTFD